MNNPIRLLMLAIVQEQDLDVATRASRFVSARRLFIWQAPADFSDGATRRY